MFRAMRLLLRWSADLGFRELEIVDTVRIPNTSLSAKPGKIVDTVIDLTKYW